MKILLHDDTPAYFAHGGKQVHVQKMYESLSVLGVDVEYARWWDPAQKCDVIHQFGCSSAIVNMAHEAGAKVVITHLTGSMANSTKSKQLYHRLRNHALRNILPNSLSQLFPWHNVNENDALVYVSKLEAETAVKIYGVSPEKTHIIPHGCGFDEIANLSGGPQNKHSHLISVGTIKPGKNSVLLIQMIHITKPFWILLMARPSFIPVTSPGRKWCGGLQNLQVLSCLPAPKVVASRSTKRQQQAYPCYCRTFPGPTFMASVRQSSMLI